MIVDGPVGVGNGWWLVLPEPYEGTVTDDGSVALVREMIAIMPDTVSYDPASTSSGPNEVLAGIVEDMAQDGELADLGPIRGTGWYGHLFREPLNPDGGEFQLLGSMSAPGTLLNLAVRFVGPDTEDDARQIIESVIHDPASTDSMNAQLRVQRTGK
jgi:hypothetical protein